MRTIKPLPRPEKVDKHLLPLKREWDRATVRRLELQLNMAGVRSVYIARYNALYVSNRNKAQAALSRIMAEIGG